jgi:hypothetical protein
MIIIYTDSDLVAGERWFSFRNLINCSISLAPTRATQKSVEVTNQTDHLYHKVDIIIIQ